MRKEREMVLRVADNGLCLVEKGKKGREEIEGSVMDYGFDVVERGKEGAGGDRRECEGLWAWPDARKEEGVLAELE